ncbi:Kinesin-like protein KIN-14G [Lamellibrachia satsuma]|nr:Kinesin-like protein KIN-14G [Lamellibrachia satsuma]
MVEIYNETIQDLLKKSTQVLEIRAYGNRIHLPGIKQMEVRSFEDIKNVFQVGAENRKTASTKMNSESSWSHLICMITVEGHNCTSGMTSTGTLTFCDLAGTERVGKMEVTGQRLVEAAAINKSLSALGQVFTAVRIGQLHVPYRNSKLNHILQPSLGGDAKTLTPGQMTTPEQTTGSRQGLEQVTSSGSTPGQEQGTLSGGTDEQEQETLSGGTCGQEQGTLSEGTGEQELGTLSGGTHGQEQGTLSGGTCMWTGAWDFVASYAGTGASSFIGNYAGTGASGFNEKHTWTQEEELPKDVAVSL